MCFPQWRPILYLGVQNDQKSTIQSQMKKNPLIWDIRPIKEDLLDYAAQDVLYLPLLHDWMKEQLEQEGVDPLIVFDES